jgi:hypothetical protein
MAAWIDMEDNRKVTKFVSITIAAIALGIVAALMVHFASH